MNMEMIIYTIGIIINCFCIVYLIYSIIELEISYKKIKKKINVIKAMYAKYDELEKIYGKDGLHEICKHQRITEI